MAAQPDVLAIEDVLVNVLKKKDYVDDDVATNGETPLTTLNLDTFLKISVLHDVDTVLRKRGHQITTPTQHRDQLFSGTQTIHDLAKSILASLGPVEA